MVALLGRQHPQLPAPVIARPEELCPSAIARAAADVPVHAVRFRVIGSTIIGHQLVAVQGADVQLPAGSRGKMTSAAGEVTLTDVQPGRYEFLVRAIGYRTVRGTIDVYDHEEVIIRTPQEALVDTFVGAPQCVIAKAAR